MPVIGAWLLRPGRCLVVTSQRLPPSSHTTFGAAQRRERGLSTGQPDISLVIPAYNEVGYLARTLEYVDEAREAYGDPSAVEVVVVDNMSTDGTAGVARAHGARVLVEEKRCIAAVRNRGARDSSGRILAFLDADSLVSRNVFNSIRETMSSGRYVGARH